MAGAERVFKIDFPGVVDKGEEIGAMVTKGGEIDLALRNQIQVSIGRLAETGERDKGKRPEIIESLVAKEAMSVSLGHLGYKLVILYDESQDLSPAKVTRGEEVGLQSHPEPVTRVQVEGKSNGKIMGWLISLPDELSGIGLMVHSISASVRERKIDQVDYTTLGSAFHVPLFREQKQWGRGEFSTIEQTFSGRRWKITPEGIKIYDAKAEGDWIPVPLEAGMVALTILGKVPRCTFYGNTIFMGAPINPHEISRLSFHLHL